MTAQPLRVPGLAIGSSMSRRRQCKGRSAGSHFPSWLIRSSTSELNSAELLSRLWNVDDDLEDVEDDEIVSSILGFLEECSAGGRPARRRVIPWEALRRVCELLAAEPAVPCVAGELEIVSGLDRWTLAREFRAAYGTTPRSFRTMRQLDKVRSLLVGGVSLAAAAAEAGFSDQSHMSRMFKKVYGFTPMRWTSAVTPARGISRHGRNLAQ